MHHGIAQALRAVPWLAACGDEVIDALAAHARLQAVADGAAVAWRGRHDDRLLVVVRGMLEVSMASPEGRRHVLNVIGPGTVFGLIPVLDRQPWIHDARAQGPGELLRLHRDAVLDTMRRHPALAEAVVQLLCARARKTYSLLAAQSLLELPARVARALLMLAGERGTPVLALPQADLADMLGVTRQSLNGQLRALARRGVVTLGRGRIELRDHAALRQAAGLWD
jgi:CRP/FNR family cyclic AMP-dependent transcriptional regulator